MQRRRGMLRQALVNQGLIKDSTGPNWPVIITATGVALALGVKLLLARSSKDVETPGLAAMYQAPSFPLIPLAVGTTTTIGLGYGLWKLADILSSPTTPAPAAPAPPTPVPQPGSLSALLQQVQPSTSVSTPMTEAPKPAWTPPIDSRWLTLAPHPSVILFVGKRGSGKTAAGYRLLELYRNQAVPYVVGLPQAARKLLPSWVGCVDRLEEVPPKAVVLVDESYVRFHARDSMGAEGRTVGQLVNLSRQRDQTLIFIVQEGRQLDVNAISQADVIAVKELSEISRDFERRELKRFTDKARAAFVGVKGNRQRWTWVHSEAAGEVGLVENELASFWKPSLSKAFAQTTPDQGRNGAATTKGQTTPREELKARVKALDAQGYNIRPIAAIMGISPTQVHRLLHEE